VTDRPHRHLPSDFSAEGLHENYGPEARYAVAAEARLPTARWDEEVARGLELGLPGADSINDRRIPTFSRGELPHFAGINTFLKAPYVEDVRTCGNYDVAVLGAPFDGGTTYRPGTRFGPQGIRRISALYGPYSFELGVDLRESITICDLGDVFTIPANIEKTFDQITKAVSHVYRGVPGRPRRRPLDRLPDDPGRRQPPERQPRHHPLRPARGHPGDRPRRADAHHSLVPRHQPAQRAAGEPGPDRHRRMAGTAARRPGRRRTQDHDHDRH
jgi:hypothetical protein